MKKQHKIPATDISNKITPDQSFVSFDNAGGGTTTNNMKSIKMKEVSQFKRGSVLVSNVTKPFMKGPHQEFHPTDQNNTSDIAAP